MFLSLDGIDGVGKSAQIELLWKWLESQGHRVATCRDPGSTPIGESIREILLHAPSDVLSMRSEMLLYMAARAQMVEEFILPKLAEGYIVIADRFLLANIVYQGYGRGLPVDIIRNIGRFACGDRLPDLTLVLDMDPQRALARLNRPLDRMERSGVEFRQRLRNGFLREAAADPTRIKVIDADQEISGVQAALRSEVLEYLQAEQD